MSRFLVVLVGSFFLPSTIALGINAPANDQGITNWDWIWTDVAGTPSSSTQTATLFVDLPANCGTPTYDDVTTIVPTNGTDPAGCGMFETSDGGEGLWVFYRDEDITGGGAQNWWRDRVVLKYDHDEVRYRGRFTGAAHFALNEFGENPNLICDAHTCATGVEFCGTMKFTDITSTSFFGNFQWCSAPL